MEKTLPMPRDREGREEVREGREEGGEGREEGGETEIERECCIMYNMRRGERVFLFFLASSPQFWRRAGKLQVACSHVLPTPTANTQALAIARHCLPVRTKCKDYREPRFAKL
jgi:hypothetical protein